MELELVNRFAIIFASLFVVVEPFGVVPTFLSLTQSFSRGQRNHAAFRAAIFGALTLVFFSLFGNSLFNLLKLNMDAFKAAGGILLFLTALDMLRVKDENCRCSEHELASSEDGHDVSLVPIGIPLLTGPGAITSIMIFSRDHSVNHALHFSIILSAIILVFLISYLVLRFSSKIQGILGKSGTSVLQRLMGLLLGAISVQFACEDAIGLTRSVLSS